MLCIYRVYNESFPERAPKVVLWNKWKILYMDSGETVRISCLVKVSDP